MADWYRMLPGGDLEGGGSMDYSGRLPQAAPSGGGGWVTASDFDIMRGRSPVSTPAPASSPMMSWASPAAPAPAKAANVVMSGGGLPAFRGPGVPDVFAGRLRNVLENPGSINSDPAFQFLRDQGLQALSRSAGAKRMRFAGKTMQDFIDYGQGAASQYIGQLVNMLSQGANVENQQYQYRIAEAQRNAQIAAEDANRADPYGFLRRIAGQYDSADAYVRANSGFSNSKSAQTLENEWRTGRRILESMRGM